MRPKLLEIEGLQSFRDVQKINFETLGETGLFGIFGPTGSGKSTVLDAITCALYGKVKRAERGTQGIINTNLNIAKVSFTFELLKDCRKTYRVERTYQRKKGSENSVEAKVARLIEVNENGDIPICDKPSEVSSSIEELLGLGHDDFTRAVVLPQNSFQEFLFLDNSKKREMLERIFYLEEYGRELLEKVNKKMSNMKSRIDVLTGELLSYQDATDVALEIAKDEMEKAFVERERIDDELKKIQVKSKEVNEIWQLVQDLAHVIEKEENQTLQKVAIDQKRSLLDRAIKAEGLLESVQKNKDISYKLKATEEQFEEVEKALFLISKELLDSKAEQDKLKTQIIVEQPKLISIKTKLAAALIVKSELLILENKSEENLKLQQNALNQLQSKNKEIEKEKAIYDSLENQIKQLQNLLKNLNVLPEFRAKIHEAVKLENELNMLKVNIEENTKQVSSLKEIIDVSNEKLERIKQKINEIQKGFDNKQNEKIKLEENKPENRETILALKEEIHFIKSIYEAMKIRLDEILIVESKLSEQNDRFKKQDENLVNLETIKAEKLSNFENCKTEMEKAQKFLEKNTAFLLSKTLIDGSPCPVCGSEQHPNPAVNTNSHVSTNPHDHVIDDFNELESKVEEANSKFEIAENDLKAVENEILILTENIKLSMQQRELLSQELEDKRSQFLKEKNRLPVMLNIYENSEQNSLYFENNYQNKSQNDEIYNELNNEQNNELNIEQNKLSSKNFYEAITFEIQPHQPRNDAAWQRFETKFMQLLGDKLLQMNLDNDKLILELDKWEKKQDELSNELLKIKDELGKEMLLENGINSGLKVNMENLKKLENSIEVVRDNLNQKEKNYTILLEGLNIDSAINEQDKLSQNDKKIELAQKQLDEITQKVSNIKNICEALQVEHAKLNEEIIKLKTEAENYKNQRNDKENNLFDLVSNEDFKIAKNEVFVDFNLVLATKSEIENKIIDVENTLKHFEKLEKEIRSKVERVESQFNELSAQKTSLLNQQKIYSESLNKEEEELKVSLIKNGFSEMEEVLTAVLSKDTQTTIKTEVDEFDRLNINLQGQKEMVLKKLDLRTVSEDEWKNVNENLKRLVEMKEEIVAHSEVTKSLYSNLNEKHIKWLELQKNHSDLSNKYGLYEQIRKLLVAGRGKDNSFIDYIAEERLRYVAAKASETLGIMTKYKYALELDVDNGFIIRDNANGGVCRPVTSLSGGETFLTSLSLALALSEQIQLKGQSPLEFFFLDEGFGTLDTGLLDTVIDSLERLSSRERVIGLISHVPELRSRIARRLVVTPPTTQGEGSKVRIEKA